MPKKFVVYTVFLGLIACFMSFKLGSVPAVKAQSAVPTAPGTWTLTFLPGSFGWGIWGTVTKPAGGSGVKHVATYVSGAIIDKAANPTWNSIQLLDGSNVVMQWSIAVQSMVGGYNFAEFSQCDLNVVGSANTPMTLRFAGAVSSEWQNVNLVGYDAQ